MASFPTKTTAGVDVIDTPIVQAAQKYARAHTDDMTYNHVMRSWLYGVIISKKLESVYGPVDQEVQALSAVFHDLGWDPTGELVSKDKRFEVDGAIAARNWVNSQQEQGIVKDWDERRTQLLWDAIALHTNPSVAAYKEPVVGLVGLGVAADFQGPKSDPTGTLTWDEFNAVKAEFPRHDMAAGIRRIILNFARTKPETTYGKNNPRVPAFSLATLIIVSSY
jgi:hypothetical protein